MFCCALFGLSAAHAATPSIVGDWFEDETYASKRVMAIAHFHPDGSFSVEFRECVKPQATDHVDTGHYTYSDNRLRMTTETQNGFWTMNIDDYLTSKNDGHTWMYKSVAGPGFREFGQVTFHDVRVTAASKMPNCELLS